jgi:uncharacterized membrane protein YdjX (TVP38/TMEM64 family)
MALSTRTMKRRRETLRTLLCLLLLSVASAFVVPQRSTSLLRVVTSQRKQSISLQGWKSDETEEEAKIEEARLKILEARRKQVRQTLKAAEALRNFRLSKGMVPEIDPTTGKPVSSDGKVAITLTAFIVALGAIALRIGGRAALVSAAGLDFLTDSPELKQNLDTVLTTADSMDPATKLLLFTACWTAVKVLCFDAGGVVLALAAGILFGGVIQGALASAAAATFGSSVAFAMAKAETPVRKKALELLEEYPSLRGIERVVARDGLKAVLTLRLAPVLPIPIGMYNYIYGVTNVPVTDFMGGIFLGSLKPYLLDSYLGYFGKEVVQGTSDPGGMQDIVLLTALGVSILIGVFASQLAAETWDSVLEEVETEKKAKAGDEEKEANDGITRAILGWELPEWAVGFQLSLKAADQRISDFILEEYEAKVWNYTSDKEGKPPAELDPANFAGSPELEFANQGFDIGMAVSDGIVLSPLLFTSFLKYADPLYNEQEDKTLQDRPKRRLVVGGARTEATRQELLQRLDVVKLTAEERIAQLEERIRREASK